MINTTLNNLSEDEAELYDRQIRLWGLDAQKRLRVSKILVCGVRGLGCEVAKDLVLAGVNSVTLLDDEQVDDVDACGQFLAPRDKIGFNRALASVERLQTLNPGVIVKVDDTDGSLATKEASFFANFDVVCVTGCSSRQILECVNEKCRCQGVKFFCGDVFGLFGFSFIDLIDHEFMEAVTTAEKEKAQDLSGLEKTITTVGEPVQEKFVRKKMQFVSMKNAFNADFCSNLSAGRIRKMDPAFFILQVLFEFQSREGRCPKAVSRAQDLKLLSSLRDSINIKYSLPQDKIQDSLLEILFEQISPVCAIVGGIISQEIIKAISNNFAPFNNLFLYNPSTAAGIVECLAKA